MTTAAQKSQQQVTTFIPISAARKLRSRMWAGATAAAFLLALVPLVWLLVVVVSRGFGAVVSPTWWVESLRGVLPEQFAGGVYHAIYGSLIQAGIAAAFAVPAGILVGIYLVEYGREGWLARAVTFSVDIVSGIPSIVAALFVFSVWVVTFGLPQSAFAVALALVLLMLPIVVRSTEEMLKIVPDDLREASYALGLGKSTTILRVVLPTALSGIVSGVLLAFARVMGETAPVLVLVGYSRSLNLDAFDGNMASLPLLIYTELINPQPAGQLRVWGAALTLIILIAAINLAATGLARYLSRRQRT